MRSEIDILLLCYNETVSESPHITLSSQRDTPYSSKYSQRRKGSTISMNMSTSSPRPFHGQLLTEHATTITSPNRLSINRAQRSKQGQFGSNSTEMSLTASQAQPYLSTSSAGGTAAVARTQVARVLAIYVELLKNRRSASGKTVDHPLSQALVTEAYS